MLLCPGEGAIESLTKRIAASGNDIVQVFTARFISGPYCPALFVVGYILWNNVQEENLELFGSERGKTIDQEEEKTENEFTHKEESRKENDAPLSR